jgi:hypothetical protein
MNLRAYYDKIRETEKSIGGEFAVVVSRETPDGGKAGTKTEVTRRVAAKMVADGAARLAEPQEAKEFYSVNAKAAADAQQRAAAKNIQVTVVPASELEAIRRGSKGQG